jgi:hypothetical protein
MFFNKLKEEMQDWVYEILAKLEDKFMQRVADAINAANQTPEELIEKYKHTQWYNVSRLVTAILEDRFNLTVAIPLAIYKGNKTVYSNSGYVGDTLSEAQKKIEKQEKIKDNFSKTHPPIVADVYGNTMKFSDFKAIEKIKTILENQKSTVKAVKAIKEVLKNITNDR